MKHLFLFVLILSSQYLAKAQAWTQKKGESYKQLSFSVLGGKRIYTPNNVGKDLRRPVRDLSLQRYLEYGITDKVTLSASLMSKYVWTTNDILETIDYSDTLEQGTVFGLTNTNFSVIYGLVQDKQVVVSLRGRLELPRWSSSEGNTGLRIGTKSWGIAPSINIGTGFGKVFSSLSFETNFRTHQYSSQIIGNIQTGIKLGAKSHLVAAFDLLKSMYNGNVDDGLASYTGLYMNNTEWSTFSLKYALNISDQSALIVTVAGGVWGNQVLKSPAISLALSSAW